jgi:hypothetical protein
MICSKNGFKTAVGIALFLMIASCTLNPFNSKSGDTQPCGNTGNGYFYLVQPYGGSSIKMGVYDTVSWTTGSTYSIPYVSIYLFNDKQFVSTIASYALNSGRYTFYAPYAGSGSKYRIKICSASDTSKNDFGCYFSLYSDYSGTIAVNKPDSTSHVVIDSTLQIGWTATGSPGGLIALALYYDTTLVYQIASSVSSALGAYTWSYVSTSKGSGSRYRIKASSYYDPSIFGFSKYFTIVSQYSGGFTFSSPSATSTWSAGSLYSIQWQTTGSVGYYVTVQIYNDSTLYTTLSTETTNLGSYSWSIPAAIASGSKYNVKISSYYDAGIFAFSPAFTIAGITPDAFEPDNKRDSASTIATTGAAQSHTLTLADTDWVKFSADSGKSYLIQTSGISSPQTYLYYGSETSYANYSTSTAPWLLTSSKTGTFFARIASYYTGAYSFKVTKYDSSTALTFLNPTSASTFSAGSSYQIQWSGDSSMFGSNVTVSLIKGTQLIQTLASGIVNSGNYSAAIPAGVFTGSDYHIKITGYYNSYVSAYSPAFTISGISPDSYEFDNIRDSAKTISVDGSVQARTLGLADTDWVKFSADSGGLYIIQTSGLTFPRTTLYYGTDASYTTYFSSSTPQIWISQRSAAVYAKIYSSSTGYAGPYTFKVTKYDSSKAITFVNPTATSTWSAGSSYQVQWSCDTSLFGSTVTPYLYKGNYLVQQYSYTSNVGSYSALVPSGLATGNDYHIRISSYYNSGITGISPAFNISGIAPDAYEPDDSASKASTIPVTGAAQNRTLTRNDKDWISFSAEKDSIYIIQATTDASVSLYLYLYAAPAISYVQYSSGYAPKITWTCPQSATYYLQVSPYSGYGNYGISVKKYTAINMVTFVNPTAQSTWSAGSNYSIQWLPDTSIFGTYVRLQLTLDTTLIQSITTSTTNSGTYSFTAPLGLATGSKYRIKMTNYSVSSIIGYSAPFTISGLDPDAFEPDDSAAIAHAIVTTGKPEIHTLPLNDNDWFSFSASPGLLYLIKTTGSTRTMSTALTLYQSDAKTPLSSSASTTADSTATVAWYCPTAGSYFFKVNSSVAGSYAASVTGNDSTKFRFTIIAPPAAGGSFTIGKTCSIQWGSQINVGGFVDLFLYNSSGVVETIVANTVNSGTYTWTIPATEAPGMDYFVKVISRFNSNIFGNSGVFSISTQ